MTEKYVHGYASRENARLQDQAGALVDLLHSDTSYPAGSLVLEAGCGVGAQTVALARNSPGARSCRSTYPRTRSQRQARERVRPGVTNVQFQQADIFALPFEPESFDHVFVCFVLEHLSRPVEALAVLRGCSGPAAPSPSSRATTARPTSIPTATPPAGPSSARSSCSARPAATP